MTATAAEADEALVPRNGAGPSGPRPSPAERLAATADPHSALDALDPAHTFTGELLSLDRNGPDADGPRASAPSASTHDLAPPAAADEPERGCAAAAGAAATWAGTALFTAAVTAGGLAVLTAASPSTGTLAAAGAVGAAVATVMTVRVRPRRNTRPSRTEKRRAAASARRIQRRARRPGTPVPGPPAVDALTGLLTRDGLTAALAGESTGADRNGVAVLLVRIDRLDLINGRLGRACGDAALARTAQRIGEAAPAAAHCARISGAGFAVVADAGADAPDWAQRIAVLAAEPFTEEGVTVTLGVSAVLVTTDGFHHDPGVLLADAEFAAGRARRTGRGLVEHTSIGLDAAHDATAAAARVQQAVLSGEIGADYQPVFDLATMEAVGAEALARWPGAVEGLEGPEDFMEVVHALGMGAELLDAILTSVCEAFATGPAAHRHWWVSVNLATDDCTDPTLPARLARILEATGMDPSRLLLEVTERAIPDPAVGRALHALAATGVKLAIDDFGSGWSSLAQLRSLPITILKIDRSLVASPTIADAHLAMAAIALARALGVETLAEGVEDGHDLLALALSECDYGQGFWWSEAEPLDTILAKFPEAPDDEGRYAPVIDLDLARALATGEPGGPDDLEAALQDALRSITAPAALLAADPGPASPTGSESESVPAADGEAPVSAAGNPEPQPSSDADESDAAGDEPSGELELAAEPEPPSGPDQPVLAGPEPAPVPEPEPALAPEPVTVIDLGEVDEASWLSLSDDDFLARLRAARRTTAPTLPPRSDLP